MRMNETTAEEGWFCTFYTIIHSSFSHLVDHLFDLLPLPPFRDQRHVDVLVDLVDHRLSPPTRRRSADDAISLLRIIAFVLANYLFICSVGVSPELYWYLWRWAQSRKALITDRETTIIEPGIVLDISDTISSALC